jgi:hypothetical protein
MIALDIFDENDWMQSKATFDLVTLSTSVGDVMHVSDTGVIELYFLIVYDALGAGDASKDRRLCRRKAFGWPGITVGSVSRKQGKTRVRAIFSSQNPADFEAKRLKKSLYWFSRDVKMGLGMGSETRFDVYFCR